MRRWENAEETERSVTPLAKTPEYAAFQANRRSYEKRCSLRRYGGCDFLRGVGQCPMKTGQCPMKAGGIQQMPRRRFEGINAWSTGSVYERRGDRIFYVL